MTGHDILGTPFATDPATLERVFGTHEDLLPLWVAEPALPLAPAVVDAVRERAATGWYGYEARPQEHREAVTAWMRTRHGWDVSELPSAVSPSVSTSIGVLLDHLTAPGDGVVLQPPVFSDFKPLVQAAGRRVVRNPLVLDGDHYRMDLDQLAEVAAAGDVGVLVLCNPHNPVGRVWSRDELRRLAGVCAAHDVVVLADELHAGLALPPHRFTPFAQAAADTGVRWAAFHGTLKTFGLAGLADTLLFTDDEALLAAFEARSNQFHLTRNNVVGLAATLAAYRDGVDWLDGLLDQVRANAERLVAGLPDGITLLPLEGTYLGWLDLRALGMDVPDLTSWLVEEARVACSPGHWFGREGAGFARLTLAVEPSIVDEALRRLTAAVTGRPR